MSGFSQNHAAITLKNVIPGPAIMLSTLGGISLAEISISERWNEKNISPVSSRWYNVKYANVTYRQENIGLIWNINDVAHDEAR